MINRPLSRGFVVRVGVPRPGLCRSRATGAREAGATRRDAVQLHSGEALLRGGGAEAAVFVGRAATNKWLGLR